MFTNYLKIALRNLLRHKGYSFINIMGLSLGLACCLVILLVVRHELSFDRFHRASDRIYRVVQHVSWGSGEVWSWTAPPMAPNLEQDFREVERAARVHFRSTLVSYEAASTPVRFQEERFGFADQSFFEVFSFPFLEGNEHEALTDPQSVVLTREVARKYFGVTNPIGKTLRIDNRLDLQITGVLENVPNNSHLQFDFLASFAALKQMMRVPEFTGWWWPQVHTYIRLRESADVARLNNEQLPAFIKKYREPEIAAAVVPQLQPITSIQLYGKTGSDGSIRYVYIFSAIAAFVLLIACINFMNLATARSAQRGREVGIRKVAGARRGQLIEQFLSEAFLTTIMTLFIALVLAELFLQLVNRSAGLSLSIDLKDEWLWLGLSLIALVVGFVSGGYPALVLSRFSPVRVLKGSAAMKIGGIGLRRILVVFQFIISVALIAGTLVVFRQLEFLRHKSLGFDQEQVIALPLHRDARVRDGYEAFKRELLQSPGIVNVSAANWLPGIDGGEIMPAEIIGIDEKVEWTTRVFFVDEDFFATMGIPIAEGGNFSADYPSDATQSFILNETTKNALVTELASHGIAVTTPLEQGLRISYGEFGQVAFEKRGKIIGVTKDFHLVDARYAIDAAVLTIAGKDMSNRFSHFLVRVSPGEASQMLATISAVWDKHFSHRPFDSDFIDEHVERAYRGVTQFGRLVGAFALLAIFIACLGLFGLASFTSEQRTKEIGIRKVLGASVAGIIALLSSEFIRLVIIGNLIAWPLVYFAMNRWLQEFAYRIEIGAEILLLAGIAAVVIACLTVSYQAIRAALANPVEALRYE